MLSEEKVVAIFENAGCNKPTERIEVCRKVKEGLPVGLGCQESLAKYKDGAY